MPLMPAPPDTDEMHRLVEMPPSRTSRSTPRLSSGRSPWPHGAPLSSDSTSSATRSVASGGESLLAAAMRARRGLSARSSLHQTAEQPPVQVGVGDDDGGARGGPSRRRSCSGGRRWRAGRGPGWRDARVRRSRPPTRPQRPTIRSAAAMACARSVSVGQQPVALNVGPASRPSAAFISSKWRGPQTCSHLQCRARPRPKASRQARFRLCAPWLPPNTSTHRLRRRSGRRRPSRWPRRRLAGAAASGRPVTTNRGGSRPSIGKLRHTREHERQRGGGCVTPR